MWGVVIVSNDCYLYEKINKILINISDLFDFADPWEEECTQPIMQYKTALTPTTLDFCPYEDVLGIGSKKGFESILAPGAGEPNPDSWQYNPFQTKKQRAETEVRMLLEKAPADTICLDPNLLAKLDESAAQGSFSMILGVADL